MYLAEVSFVELNCHRALTIEEVLVLRYQDQACRHRLRFWFDVLRAFQERACRAISLVQLVHNGTTIETNTAQCKASPCTASTSNIRTYLKPENPLERSSAIATAPVSVGSFQSEIGQGGEPAAECGSASHCFHRSLCPSGSVGVVDVEGSRKYDDARGGPTRSIPALFGYSELTSFFICRRFNRRGQGSGRRGRTRETC